MRILFIGEQIDRLTFIENKRFYIFLQNITVGEGWKYLDPKPNKAV